MDGLGARHHSVADAVLEVPLTRTALGVDEDTLTPLGKAVLRAVDHAPLDRIAKGRQARQDDCEVAPTLLSGALEEPVDVLEHAVAGVVRRLGKLDAKEAIDVPPQDALLALNACGLREWASD